MADTDQYYMNEALKEAQSAAQEGEVPVGAVIVWNGRIIARAHNLCETLSDPTAHAEMQAITAACEYIGGKALQDCTIFVTVEPCPMCAAALYWSQIGRIVYGCKDEKRGFSLFSPLLVHPKSVVVAGVLAEESAKIMKDFFKARR